VIDERRGRAVATRLGVAVKGTLGVLVLAKRSGLMPAVAPVIQAMRERGLWLGAEVVAEVLSLAGEGPAGEG